MCCLERAMFNYPTGEDGADTIECFEFFRCCGVHVDFAEDPRGLTSDPIQLVGLSPGRRTKFDKTTTFRFGPYSPVVQHGRELKIQELGRGCLAPSAIRQHSTDTGCRCIKGCLLCANPSHIRQSIMLAGVDSAFRVPHSAVLGDFSPIDAWSVSVYTWIQDQRLGLLRKGVSHGHLRTTQRGLPA